MRYQNTNYREFATWIKTGETVEIVRRTGWGHAKIKLQNGEVIPQPENFLTDIRRVK